MIQIALSSRRLSGWYGRGLPGDVREIKELGHVHLGCVPLGETGNVKSCFNQLEPCRVVGDGVRDIVLFRKWRYHNQRYSISGVNKVTIRPGVRSEEERRVGKEW